MLGICLIKDILYLRNLCEVGRISAELERRRFWPKFRYYLRQWFSIRDMRRHLMGNAKQSYRLCKIGKELCFVINAEYSGPDLWLATGDPDVRTFD
jgi:hypothetical protein